MMRATIYAYDFGPEGARCMTCDELIVSVYAELDEGEYATVQCVDCAVVLVGAS